MISAMLYFPSCFRPSMPVPYPAAVRSLAEHLHRLHQARSHALERAGERCDLVSALDRKAGGVELPEAHLVGDLRQPRDGPDHDVVEHRIEGDEYEREHNGERYHEHLERVLRALDRK